MEFIKELLIGYGMGEKGSNYLSAIILVILIILLCVVANYVTKKIVLRLITNIVKKTKAKWDNILLEHKVFNKISHIVPAIIIYYFASSFSDYKDFIERVALCYMLAVGISALNSLLNASIVIYSNFEISKTRPIRGLIQVVKIVVFIVGGITLIAIIIDKNPLLLLSGLGALSAVLMLVFKDSILGFVAGIQLSSNDMIRVGDWIEMPKYNADGDVIEISLNTIKVHNWDKTVTMIPSYALISDAFKNWRGMQETGGRRIKRSVYIDTASIQFCTEEMLERFKRIHYLTEYIESKEAEIEEYNKEHNINRESKVNGRGLTNIGTFRVYIQNYLKNHPGIHKELITMVRQLASGEDGLPLEIYCFTSDIRWVYHETVQADIFDHIFAVAPEFGLRVFQKPSGFDIRGYGDRQVKEQ
ncbi:MAG TPA: mechanosensitive ion channel domain-containing protein [Thermoclostridium sp.]|nr:mechanosensitive ion channel domain-containing protein [Thermoclostridium sp.]